MAISYNRLWKQLIDHGLSKTDMMHRAKISTNVLARLSKGEPVSMDSMEKICTMLGCNIGDVMEFIPDTENGGIDGLILAHIEQMPAFQYAKKQLCDTASLLERKASIPQIKAKLPMLQEIHTDAFWDANDILLFEQVRKELRELIRFLDEGGGAQRQIVTKLTDPIIDSQEGVQLEAAYDFEDYRAKVNRYVNEHGNTLAIYKLTHNIPLAMGDYQELERVLTSELGSKEDYAREFGDTPFGLLIRKIAKLDHEAAMQAFSAFINDQSLNQKQIAFVNKIINHIELNGYMENVAELTKPPFDKPISFIKLFDAKTRTALMETINQVRENAVQITAS